MARLLDDDNRIGMFRLDLRVIEREPEITKKIMGKTIIYRAEYLLVYNAIEYIAYSDLFEKMPKGSHAPEYKFIIEDGKIVGAERVD